jgi:hypothetical protein
MSKNTNKKNILKLQKYIKKLEKQKTMIINGSRMDNCDIHSNIVPRNDRR